MAKQPMITRSIRMKKETWEELDKLAADRGTVSSEIVRAEVDKVLKANKRKQ